MGIIENGSNRSLFCKNGTAPDVSGALQDYYQNMVFTPVAKIVKGFQVVETGDPINFRGVIQPLKPRAIALKPEGQRAWTWFMINSDPALNLNVDDVVEYLGVQTRVMARTDFRLYGYMYYEVVQDWKGSGPV